MWIDTPMVGATVTNDVRRHDYTLTITKPNGENETKHWDIITDSTSVQYLQYTPDQVGIYTLNFVYPDQNYTFSGAYQGDLIKGASRTITLSVQQEPVPASLDSYPLPTEYWTRPIEDKTHIGIQSRQTGGVHLTTLALMQATMDPADIKTMA